MVVSLCVYACVYGCFGIDGGFTVLFCCEIWCFFGLCEKLVFCCCNGFVQ